MTLYDLSPPLGPALAVWPGDRPVRLEHGLRRTAGDSVNLASVEMSLHAGSHADAPLHFRDDGAGADRLELHPYLGPALVADVTGWDPIPLEALEKLDLALIPRLLLRTGGWPDTTRFPDRIPHLTDAAARWLGEQRLLLLGVDVPSVDALDSTELPVHRILDQAGIRILESLHLHGVPEGVYELIALPLPFVGGDGSPVRAVLRR